MPYVFTEHGVAMLAGVLKSKKTIEVNIEIIRAFIILREMVISNKELWYKIDQMEKKYDKQFKIVFDAIRQLMIDDEKPKQRIGFSG